MGAAEMKAQEYRPQTTDHRPQTTDHRPQMICCTGRYEVVIVGSNRQRGEERIKDVSLSYSHYSLEIAHFIQ
jgi:hypothetical protein